MKNDGGPAAGMTLRQWYAGQALANHQVLERYGFLTNAAANYCFKLTDAMIVHEIDEAKQLKETEEKENG